MMSEHGYHPSFHSSFQHEGTIELFIETLTGTAFEITVSPFDTVLSIKLKIHRVEGENVHVMEEMLEHLPPGCQVTVLLFREGDQVNLFRVVENEDGSYSPLSQSWNGTSLRNLFAEEDSEVEDKRLHENSVTMGKVQDLRAKMEKLSLQKKVKQAIRGKERNKKSVDKGMAAYEVSISIINIIETDFGDQMV
ncbi:unnamed protein product [Timema podura]|uniref:Uncharacterized protein n=1 Tax=Timema podura TaxID=61482 RepID=A0ABN7NPG4_TIMPD|nr:unnamed protein product [Timema podura]